MDKLEYQYCTFAAGTFEHIGTALTWTREKQLTAIPVGSPWWKVWSPVEYRTMPHWEIKTKWQPDSWRQLT